MDPRQSISRTSSSNVPQNSYQPNTMATSYSMPAYQNTTYLPPINHQGQGYVPQQPYRNDMQPRYPPVSAPGGGPGQDRYNQHMTPPTSSMAPMLPQPQNQPTPPQNYPQQQGTRQGYQPALAPAPPRPSGLEALASNYGHPDGRQPAWSGPDGIPGMTSDVGRDPTRTHVVGSQGRRGILPSAPGRPAVSANGLNGSPKGGLAPAKDADGKYPCPNCTKTYLHAKHLKRHMLRHTGDRPYMCVLCNDTFSRSDILKRHFQKCSVRRGNPTGASHLSNPAAHLKKSQAAAAKAAANAAANAGTTTPTPAQTPTSSSLPGGPYTSTSAASSTVPTSAGAPPPSSMAYSMSTPAQADLQRPQQTQGQDPGNNQQWGMHGGRSQPMMYHQGSSAEKFDHFPMQNQGGDDKRVGHMGDDWNQMFPGGPDQQYMNPVFSGYDQAQKNGNHENGQQNGYYLPPTSLGANPDGTHGPRLLWSNPPSQDVLFHLKANRLIDFCFPQESLHEQPNNLHLRDYLRPEAIEHFSNQYVGSLGQHLPWLHVSTFDPVSIYDGLLAVIVCGGALYSDQIPSSDIQELLILVQKGIHRTARIHQYIGQHDILQLEASASDIEELYSLHLSYGMQIWHGPPEDRQAAREATKDLMLLTHQFGLDRLANQEQPHAYSYLHNLKPGQKILNSLFDWHKWVEQEKRVRLMSLLVLADCALSLYFNMEPFDISDVRLPLPADDAAFEAPDANACAQALGLLGAEAQSKVNVTGSLNSQSLSFSSAVKALHDSTTTIPPRATNVYSKFILIHALLTEIWLFQKYRSVHGAHIAEEQHRSIIRSLNQWKQCWDTDISLQYPLSSNHVAPRRIGFCRDGIHFWFLAKALLQPNRMHDHALLPDQKLQLMMKGLGQAKQWSLSDSARRGEEPGSVALIDIDYASSDTLVLDMRKLFRPLDG